MATPTTLAETERLIIRSFTLEDLPAYAKIVSDPDVMTYIGNGKPVSYEDAETYLAKCIAHFEEKGWSRFAVEIKDTGELAGFCGYMPYNNELDFGWRYAKKFWGQGYGTEAAKAALELAVDKFQFPRIVCISKIGNLASINIIEKIGMEFEKEISLNGARVKQYIYPQ